MHPRACVSAISHVPDSRSTKTSRSGRAHGIDQRRRVGREARSASAGTTASRASPTRSARTARRQPHRPRTVPPRATRRSGPQQQRPARPRASTRRDACRRRVPGVHDRPAGAARVGGGRRRARDRARHRCSPTHARAGVPFAIEHTNSLRVDVGFVHTLRDAIDLARRLDTGVCMEINACWAERDLGATDRAPASTASGSCR